MNVRAAVPAIVTLLPAACAAPRVETCRDEKSVPDRAIYFNGRVDAWGMFRERSGKVVKRFQVAIGGRWKDNVGTQACVMVGQACRTLLYSFLVSFASLR